MENYENIEKKYRCYMKKNMDFSIFLENVLENYFNEENIIVRLFDLRNEEDRLISETEIVIAEKDEEVYNELLVLCGRENKEKLDDIISKFEENKQNLIELYSKDFYKMGIKDGKSLKKNF